MESSKRLSAVTLQQLLVLVMFIVVAGDATTGDTNKNAHFESSQRNGIVHLFEWKFEDIAEECKEFLGPKGYAGVQLSPVTEHLVVRTDLWTRPWWERYHPVSYRLATRSGDEEAFRQMSTDCNEAGVRVYVDVVLNHMAGELSTGEEDAPVTGTDGSVVNISSFDYPDIPYALRDFRQPACLVGDYSDAHEVRNCQLEGRPDLNHSRAEVRSRIVELLNKLVELGVAGFHVNAAKYMWPTDLELIFNEVNNLNSVDFNLPSDARPFVYMDVFDLGLDGISKTEYSSFGVVTEYLYAAELSTILSGKVPLSSLINWGPAMGFLPHQDVLVFVDSHEGQRSLDMLGSNQLLTYRQRQKYIMANAFMLAHPYGSFKRIMSSYYFPRTWDDQGPPIEDEGEEDEDPIRTQEFDELEQCTVQSGWVCEHRWPAIVNMLALANGLIKEQDSLTNFQTYGPNHIAFCRGNKAFIAINNDLELEYATEVHTCLEEGVYCDVISGGLSEDAAHCRGTRISVDSNGNAVIALPVVDAATDEELPDQLGNVGVLAIFVGSRLLEGAAGEQTSAEDEATTADIDEIDIDEHDPNNDVEIFENDEEELEDVGPVDDETEVDPVDDDIVESFEDDEEDLDDVEPVDDETEVVPVDDVIVESYEDDEEDLDDVELIDEQAEVVPVDDEIVESFEDDEEEMDDVGAVDDEAELDPVDDEIVESFDDDEEEMDDVGSVDDEPEVDPVVDDIVDGDKVSRQ